MLKSLIRRLDHVDHEFILTVESYPEWHLPGLAEEVSGSHAFGKAENGLIGGITRDDPFGQSVVDCALIEFSSITDACQSGQLRQTLGLVSIQAWCTDSQVRIQSDHVICDAHLILGECASLVGADDVDSSESLDSLQRLAQDLVLLHDAGDDSERCCNSNRKTFGDESDCDADTINDEDWDGDPVRISFA
jgi:hypothetical protein